MLECWDAGMLELKNSGIEGLEELADAGRPADVKNGGKDCSTVNRSTCLIGMVARFNPQKDHHNLVRAARIFDVGWENEKLADWIRQDGLEDRFFLLGPRDDIPMITAGLDIACLSSAHGEGFPNVLGEAMACEVPCVATDVGGQRGYCR